MSEFARSVHKFAQLRTVNLRTNNGLMTQKQYASVVIAAAISIFGVVLKNHPDVLETLKTSLNKWYKSLANRTKLSAALATRTWDMVNEFVREVINELEMAYIIFPMRFATNQKSLTRIYRNMILKYHPDKSGGDRAKEIAQHINNARDYNRKRLESKET